MRVLMIAGEPSGDLHGSGVVRELKRRDPRCEVFGIGGDKMQAAGMELGENARSHRQSAKARGGCPHRLPGFQPAVCKVRAGAQSENRLLYQPPGLGMEPRPGEKDERADRPHAGRLSV
ncbi:MAG: hypothetical protein E6K56_11035 [Ignavibacteria bacterium]|nr:MAG: hypothetical protein E6K56_11035 [Ignavibacteria bacterium]